MLTLGELEERIAELVETYGEKARDGVVYADLEGQEAEVVAIGGGRHGDDICIELI